MIRTELHSFPFKTHPVNGTDWIDCLRKDTTQNMEPIDHPRGPNHAHAEVVACQPMITFEVAMGMKTMALFAGWFFLDQPGETDSATNG